MLYSCMMGLKFYHFLMLQIMVKIDLSIENSDFCEFCHSDLSRNAIHKVVAFLPF